jgi:TonB family protein
LRGYSFALSVLLTLTGARAQDAPAPPDSIAGRLTGQLVSRVEPVYPSATANGISGNVVLRLRIGKDGSAQKVVVLSGPEPLRAAAVDAVWRWRYSPYLIHGNATQIDTTVTLYLAPDSARAPTVSLGVMIGINGTTAAMAGSPMTGTDAMTPPPVQVASGARGPARVSGGEMAAQLLNSVTPTYPPIARAAHVSGAVVLRAIIGKDGLVEDLEVISGPEMLRASALAAVRQWTYQPYLLNGVPVEVDTVVTVNYSIASPPSETPPPP